MTINYILFYIYIIGAIIACVLGIIEGYLENKEGKDISDFPTEIAIIIFMSWYYVYYFIKKRLL